jgi:hypothetical protein
MTTAVISTSTTRTLREFDTYDQAQHLVDRLSDAGFPVDRVRIVGTGIRTVEQVTGRMTKGRAAIAGAAGGAWFGLLIGLLLGMFTIGSAWLPLLLGSLMIGAFWGAVFGFVAQWGTRGRRDFSSVRGLEAARYSVEVEDAYVDEAARLAGIA